MHVPLDARKRPGGHRSRFRGEYCGDVEQELGKAWALRVARLVGQRVQFYRKTAGPGGKRLTTDALSTKCAELDYPIDRSVIAKLERGLRHSVTLAEVLVLARALEVPPLSLMVPLGEEQDTEILPGDEMGTWPAARWIVGYGDDERVGLYHEHERLVQDLLKPGVGAWVIAPGVEPDQVEQKLEVQLQIRWNVTLRLLNSIRQNMRLSNLLPPAVPDKLADYVT